MNIQNNLVNTSNANLKTRENPSFKSVNITKVIPEIISKNFKAFSAAMTSLGIASILINKSKKENEVQEPIKNETSEEDYEIEVLCYEPEEEIAVQLVDDNELQVAELDEVEAELIDDEDLYIVTALEMPHEKTYNNPKLNKYLIENYPDRFSQEKFDKIIETMCDTKYDSILTTLINENEGNYPKEMLKQKARMLIDEYRKKLSESDYIKFYASHPELFKKGWESIYTGGSWQSNIASDGRKCSWKMHIFSTDNYDWQLLSKAIIPYLQDNDISWKTCSPNNSPENLARNQKQSGKAFTIYPKSVKEMEQIAKDLDYIIRNNDLQTIDSNIVGDNNLGDSGRLFYRYEYSSKKYKDKVLDINSEMDMLYYHSIYDRNRGEGKYLALDMTTSDDIWQNFDPSNPYSRIKG